MVALDGHHETGHLWLCIFFHCSVWQQQQSQINKMMKVWIQECNISMIPICCISLEELRGLASNQLCHGNVGWWPAYGAVGGSE